MVFSRLQSSREPGQAATAAVAAFVSLALWGNLVQAQSFCPASSPPWPNGCSLGLSGWAQQGLDSLFLEACDHHDTCWGQCNGPTSPYLGLGHKAQCDATFLGEMESACILVAPLISLPLGQIQNANQFLETCAELAAASYAAVATP